MPFQTSRNGAIRQPAGDVWIYCSLRRLDQDIVKDDWRRIWRALLVGRASRGTGTIRRTAGACPHEEQRQAGKATANRASQPEKSHPFSSHGVARGKVSAFRVRETVHRNYAKLPARAFVSRNSRAYSAPTRTASAMLTQLALPVPAMSNAVPWSTLERTNGRPVVIAIVFSKSMLFAAMWPWSWNSESTASAPPCFAMWKTE